MSQLKNFYTISPAELKPGDVLAAIVTCHIQHIDTETDTVYIRTYRCALETQTDENDIPQGSPSGNDVELARMLFPFLNAFTHIKVL